MMFNPASTYSRASRDPPGVGGRQVSRCHADVVDVHQLADRGPVRGLVEEQIEVLQAARRPRLDGAGRNGMHADALGPQLIGQVANARLQRRLHRTHDAVRGHDLVRPVVGHGEQRAALGHQRRRQACHAHKRVAGHVHGQAEAGRGAVEQGALQVLLRGEGDGVQGDVEPAPRPADLLEDRFQLPRLLHVEGQENRRLQLPRQGLDVRPGLVVQVSDGQLGAELAEGASTAERDRVLVGDAEHQGLLAQQRRRRDGRPCSLSFLLTHVVSMPLIARKPIVNAQPCSVCWAIINSSFVGMTKTPMALPAATDA